MIPYFILIALPLLVRMIGTSYRFTSEKKLLYETRAGSIDVFMFIFLLLLAFRGLQCGVDTKQYLRLFNEYSAQNVSQLLSSYDHEFGYKLLNRLVGLVGGSYRMLLIITSVICVVPLWYFYKRESQNQLLTIALFLTVAPYMMYFSGIRQAIAISLGIPAWYAAKNKKLWLFVVMVLLAMQFHLSAFMLFLLYPLYHMNITKKWLWFVVPCMVAVFIFRSVVFTVLSRLFWNEYSAIQETGATTILLLLVLFGLYSYILADEDKMDRNAIAMRNILLLSIVLQIFAMLHPAAMRMNYYFLIFVPILIPKIASSSKKQYAQIARWSVAIMTTYFICYFLEKVITDGDSLNIIPYIPFWRN